MPYKQDIWLPRVAITASNNSFVITEDTLDNGFASGTTSFTTTVLAGDHYMHNDTGVDAAVQGFYAKFLARLNATGAANTYTMIAIAPTQSSGMVLGGVQLRALTAVHAFRIAFDHASWTLEPEWFGFRRSDSVTTTRGSLTWTGNPLTGNVIDSTTSGSDEIITGDFTCRDRWLSQTHGNAVHGARDKRAYRYGNRRFSSSRISDAVSVEWDSGRNRHFRYEWVKSPHIFTERADDTADTAWLTDSNLAALDTLNAFDDVWVNLARLQPALVIHNLATVDLQLDTHDYELVRLLREDQAGSFESVIEMQREAGEFYAIDLDVQIDTTYDNYPH
jgi:hypothetical protein